MDPPPPTIDSTGEAHIAPAANPTPTKAPALNHPPYAEVRLTVNRLLFNFSYFASFCV